mgnify:CR=1 FL=1
MKLIDDYCEKMRKKTERLLLKMFNYKTIKEAFDERKYLISELKKSTGKDIADFEDIANAVAFFACDDSSYITGNIMEVSGGYHLGTPQYAEFVGHKAVEDK